jgi:hypothetical protein
MVSLDVRDRVAVSQLLVHLRPTAVIHTAANMSSAQAMQREVCGTLPGHSATPFYDAERHKRVDS